MLFLNKLQQNTAGSAFQKERKKDRPHKNNPTTKVLIFWLSFKSNTRNHNRFNRKLYQILDRNQTL